MNSTSCHSVVSSLTEHKIDSVFERIFNINDYNYRVQCYHLLILIVIPFCAFTGD